MEEGCFSYCGSTHLPPPTIHHHHSAVVSRAKHSNSVGISWLHVFRMRNLYTRKIQSRIKLLSQNSHVCVWIWSKQCTSTLHTHTSYTSCINIIMHNYILGRITELASKSNHLMPHPSINIQYPQVFENLHTIISSTSTPHQQQWMLLPSEGTGNTTGSMGESCRWSEPSSDVQFAPVLRKVSHTVKVMYSFLFQRTSSDFQN